MLLTILLFFFILLCWCHLKSYWIYRVLTKNVPCEVLHPIFRNAFFFTGSSEEITGNVMHLMSRQTRRVGIWISSFFTLYVMNATDIELMMKSKFISKGTAYKMFEIFAEENIFAIDTNAKYKQKKKIIAPWFQTSNVKNLTATINESIADFVKILNGNVGREFDAEHYIALSIMSVTLELFTGLKRETFDILLPSIIESAHGTVDLISTTLSKEWLKPNFVRKIMGYNKPVTQFQNLSAIIFDRMQMERQNRRQVEKKFVSFLDYLSDRKTNNNDEFDTEDMKNAFRTMLIAGPHTIISSVSFALSLLGIHKDVQKKLFEELELILPKEDEAITYKDLQKCEYLERVIQETWRLYAPSLLILRQATGDVTLGDLNIPKGTNVLINLYGLHRNPEVYANPHEFDPDNFLPEKVNERNPFSFMPFSVGIRSCIGQRVARLVVKLYVATIIRNFEVHSNIPEKNFRLAFDVVLRRKEGTPLVLQPRNKM